MTRELFNVATNIFCLEIDYTIMNSSFVLFVFMSTANFIVMTTLPVNYIFNKKIKYKEGCPKSVLNSVQHGYGMCRWACCSVCDVVV